MQPQKLLLLSWIDTGINSQNPEPIHLKPFWNESF